VRGKIQEWMAVGLVRWWVHSSNAYKNGGYMLEWLLEWLWSYFGLWSILLSDVYAGSKQAHNDRGIHFKPIYS